MTARPVRGAAGPRTRAKVHDRRPGTHRNGRGTPKLGYLTEERALEAAAEMSAANRHAMSAYRCTECGLWHLGRGR